MKIIRKIGEMMLSFGENHFQLLIVLAGLCLGAGLVLAVISILRGN